MTPVVPGRVGASDEEAGNEEAQHDEI
jgi:hypothetical protein